MSRRKLLPSLLGGILFAAALLLQPEWLSILLFFIAYFAVGGEVLYTALRNILRGEIFDENFLMSLATIGALAVRNYPEAVAVMLFYQVGELFQSYAVDKSRRSIGELMDIRPDRAARLLPDGSVEQVDPDAVAVGEEIRIQPGEKVPLDGVVTAGSAQLDTAALTGESVPRTVAAGDDILSGCINLDGVLTVRVTKPFGDSTVSKILDLVENAGSRKAKSEKFISRFAAVYTPAVVIAALLLALIPPLLLRQPFHTWIYRACTFLVVSCPCALVISIPLTLFGGIGGASKAGILVKGGNYLEVLAATETAVFDKTGTLTHGTFTVQEVCPQSIPAAELLSLAAAAEYHSHHPIALSLKSACPAPLSPDGVQEVREIAGNGIEAQVGDKTLLVGNRGLLEDAGIAVPALTADGTVVCVAIDRVYAGYIRIADTVKPDAVRAIQALRDLHVRRTVMLTGDNRAAGEAVAAELGLDAVYTELLPADKVDIVEKLLRETSKNGKLLFVGDGINDAPVLARADIGIALGALGSDAAIEAADVVLMTDEPSKIATAIRLARKTQRIVRENIVFALAVKLLVLLCSALGLAGMWAAVFADVGVSVIAILNALRMLKTAN